MLYCEGQMNKPKLIIGLLIVFTLFLGYFIGKNPTSTATIKTQVNLPYEQIKVSGVDSTKQKQVEDFITLFYNHKHDKDTEKLMSLFAVPSTPKEQDDLDFILGKDYETNDKPLSRLFSTQGYEHTTSGYFIRDISLVGGDIKVSVDELRTFYSSGEYVGFTAQVSNLTFYLVDISDGLKIKSYYHQSSQGKFEGFTAY